MRAAIRVGSVKHFCSRFFIRESLLFSRLFNASVLAGERQHFRARAAPPHTGAVVAISKIMSTQWRKVDGRWRRPEALFAERIYTTNYRFKQVRLSEEEMQPLAIAK
jgi:hypothetical protein